ncbi:MAG: adenylosuccinate lyase [Candidatus Eiseniibacteriota bacterium]
MIARYVRPEMAALWTDEARYRRWLDVECAATGALEAEGLVPPGTAASIRAHARVEATRVDALEATLHHDVIAFLTAVGESLGPERRFLHQGMTSSDLVDTALALVLQEAGRVLLSGFDRLERVLAALAARHRTTLTVGRTHGIHAEPTTFGLKVLGWALAVRRSRLQVEAGLAETAVGKLSGAVGQAAHLPLSVEERFLASLGLRPETVATQVVARDRHAALVASLAHLTSNYERIANEIRHLQRTEVREVEEPFGTGQKGSSSMPHKRNPVVCERIAGLARLFRGYAVAAYEDVALWHERDISHSSVERVILPDAFLLADYLTDRLSFVLEGLAVDASRMRANLEASGGLVFSQRVLLALTEAGLAREDAYAIVQRNAMRAWHGEGSFRDLLATEPEVRARLGDRLAQCFDVTFYLSSVDELFARAERELARPLGSVPAEVR